MRRINALVQRHLRHPQHHLPPSELEEADLGQICNRAQTRTARTGQIEREGKKALLLSRKIVTALYHNDDAALKRTMTRTGIDEEQDLISRFIRGTDRMTVHQLAEFIRLL